MKKRRLSSLGTMKVLNQLAQQRIVGGTNHDSSVRKDYGGDSGSYKKDVDTVSKDSSWKDYKDEGKKVKTKKKGNN